MGVDVHPLVNGRPLFLCGVKIPHDKGLGGVSDADAAIHALVDALMGAVGGPDIGTLFPEDDPENKDRSSRDFLLAAVASLHELGYHVNNVDLTIVAQAPKLAPHVPAMRRSLAEIMNIGEDRIGIKATTTEHLGFTGRGEGITALAVATVE